MAGVDVARKIEPERDGIRHHARIRAAADRKRVARKSGHVVINLDQSANNLMLRRNVQRGVPAQTRDRHAAFGNSHRRVAQHILFVRAERVADVQLRREVMPVVAENAEIAGQRSGQLVLLTNAEPFAGVIDADFFSERMNCGRNRAAGV